MTLRTDRQSFTRRWTRRLAAGVAVASLAAAGITPLSAKAQSSRAAVNLTFWSWVPPAGLNPAIQLFNKTHSGIKVTLQVIPSGPNGGYAKMFTAIKANNAPDLGQVEYQFLPTFEATGGLQDMAAYGAAAYKNDFVPWTWGQVTQGSAIYAIPQDTGPTAMFYREDVFKKYHIAVPTTWAQYAAAAATLHKANPKMYIVDFPPKEQGWFIGFVWQAGGRWFRVNGNSWQVNIDDAASTKVASFWQNLLDKKLVKTDPDFTTTWYNDLNTGQVVTWPTAVWGANTIMANAPKTKGLWRVAPMPQWSSSKRVDGNWGGSTTVVFKDSKHPKEAAEFAEWLNTNQQSIADMVKGAQLYPADKAALDSSAVNGPMPYYGNQNVNRVFQQASNYVDVSFRWGPTMDQVFTDQADLFSNAVNGKYTLTKALNQLQSSTVSAMKKQGFPVKGS